MTQLLTQNSKLKKTSKEMGVRVFNFGIPATKDPETNKITCPFAGACKKFCYATKGAYAWSNVKPAFAWRYQQTKADGFVQSMVQEVTKKKADFIRVHDSGDYYAPKYIDKWFEIAKQLPDVKFYSYTKSMPLFLGRDLPKNYDIIFSEGSTVDHLIDKSKHRHSSIFKSAQELEQADYCDASKNDLMATKWFNKNHRIGLIYH